MVNNNAVRRLHGLGKMSPSFFVVLEFGFWLLVAFCAALNLLCLSARNLFIDLTNGASPAMADMRIATDTINVVMSLIFWLVSIMRMHFLEKRIDNLNA